MQRPQHVGHRGDRARAGLKDRGRVQGNPLKAHRLELDYARHDPVVLDVEPLARGVARR
jgi:hypothetical protein